MSNDLTIEFVHVGDLTPDPANARKHSKRNLDAIAASLSKFGQRRPLVVTHAGVVIAGNGTLEAAKGLGWEHVAVTRTPADWDDDRARAYALADNRTAELAEWDNDILGGQLVELEAVGWDTGALGFEPVKDGDDDLDTSSQLGETKYAVIIDVPTEWEQAELLEKLVSEGLAARPLML